MERQVNESTPLARDFVVARNGEVGYRIYVR